MTHGKAAASWLLIALLGTGAPAHAASWFDRLRDALGGGDGAGISESDIAAGLKEALTVGTGNVIARLGVEDGFNLDPAVHIPLPRRLEKARNLLARVDMAGSLDELELQLNRAAEQATPRARALFVDAIGAMTLDDVMGIYNGPEDAATRYFRAAMAEPLALEMLPLVEQSLADVGAAVTYAALVEQYQRIPFAPAVDADLNRYVVDRGVDAVFLYLAREEAAIRADPAKRTTELLRRVFGRQE